MAAEGAQAGEATKRQGSAQEGLGHHQRRERARGRPPQALVLGTDFLQAQWCHFHEETLPSVPDRTTGACHEPIATRGT